ncbi:MAG: hypothetical protein WC834_02510 [Eubacteriales bacterium]
MIVMKFKAPLYIFTLLFATTLLSASKSYAAAPNAFCQPDETTFTKIGNAFKSLDIRKTVQNMMTSAMTDGLMNAVANRSPKQMMECSWYVLNKNKQEAAAANVPFEHQGLLTKIETDCPEIKGSTPDCEDFVQTYDSKAMYYNIGGQKLGFNQTTTSGSLLGFANTVEGVVITEPLPTNLAYFWNDSIRNVPFASTALAANTSYANAPMIDSVLQIWKTVRNVAFGLLSVVMLVVGVMIMMKKKLSPQLVVTAQYALPRIALAVVLIVFSYPIGAVMASSMRYLTDLMHGIVWGAASTGSMSDASSGGLGLLIGLLLAGLLGFVGVAMPIMIATAVFVVVMVVLYIAVWVKAILLYVKLIVSIVLAPVSFALGAIPGNESMSENWFKHALANVLSYIGMFTFLNIGLVIIGEVVKTPTTSFGTGTTSLFAFLLLPIIIIWILLQTLKVPGKIETLIMGDPKKPVRK